MGDDILNCFEKQLGKSAEEAAALNVACPRCGEPKGAKCVTYNGKPTKPHKRRIEASIIE